MINHCAYSIPYSQPNSMTKHNIQVRIITIFHSETIPVFNVSILLNGQGNTPTEEVDETPTRESPGPDSNLGFSAGRGDLLG